MSIVNGTITPPVSIDDVKSILGESSNDLATLCKSSKINMWAKYKPVDSDSPFLNISTGWKGKRGDCNISYPKTNTITAVKDYYSQDNNGYSYRTAQAPYRLGDFRGYNSLAATEYRDLQGTTPVAENDVSIAAAYNVSSADSDWISMSDLLDNEAAGDVFHFGVLLYNRSGTLRYFRTSDDNIVKFTSVVAGTYTVYPFMSSVDYSDSDFPTFQAGTYMPVPVLKPITIEVKTKQQILNGYMTLTQTAGYGATLKNIDTKSHVVSLHLRFSSSTEGSAFVIGEATLISNTTLAAGDSKTVLFGTKMDGEHSYSLWLYIDYTLVQKQTIFQDSSTIS